MSSTTLVPYTPQRRWLEVMSPAADLAKSIAGTEFVPKSLRNNPAAIAAAILFGDEVGFGPMQSLARIAVIEGKPALSAEAQRALILQAGHELWVEDSTTTRVTVAGRRKGSDEVTRFTWTMDDAKRANLAGKPSWRSYPRQMLLARASAELARAVFADAIGGLAAIEELEDPVDAADAPAGNGAETPETATRRRKRKTTALAPAASSGPAPEPAPGPPLPGEEEEPEAPVEEAARPVEPEPEPRETDLTLYRAKKAMDSIVGQLREKMHTVLDPETGEFVEKPYLVTEHLWQSLSEARGEDYDEMILRLGGLDEQGELHWGPLRDDLTLQEARELHARLARYWKNVESLADSEETT